MSNQYWPSAEFTKVAVLIELADPAAVTEIKTSFGQQRMTGSFYVVADGDGSYGAARSEFEASHRHLGNSAWVKVSPVVARQLGESDEPVRVQTLIDGSEEGSVIAQPGDWIVQQVGGERMVISASEFSRRYTRVQPAGPDT